jgi:hypothetical protein
MESKEKLRVVREITVLGIVAIAVIVVVFLVWKLKPFG